MSLLPSLVTTLALVLSAADGSAQQAVAKVVATGQYVEARTASVYAGACHFNGEFTLRGREAFLAWSFEEGESQDVDLTGVTVVAIVAGDANLSLGGTKRRSVLYVDKNAPLAARDAAVELLLKRHGDQLGKVLDVETVAVSISFDKDGYSLEIPKIARLSGVKMPDRECCKMPFNVWYDPFVPLDKPVVGRSERFQYAGGELGSPWSTSTENNAFVSGFTMHETPTP